MICLGTEFTRGENWTEQIWEHCQRSFIDLFWKKVYSGQIRRPCNKLNFLFYLPDRWNFLLNSVDLDVTVNLEDDTPIYKRYLPVYVCIYAPFANFITRQASVRREQRYNQLQANQGPGPSLLSGSISLQIAVVVLSSQFIYQGITQ